MIIIYCPRSVYCVFYLQISALKHELSAIFGYEILCTDNFETINRTDIVICFGFQIMVSTLKIKNICTGYNIIIYNTEQLHTKNWGYLIYYMRNALEIWDYSKKNIQTLIDNGIHNVRYVPFGYSAAYELIDNMDDDNRYDKSLTFIGALNQRRSLYQKKLSRDYQVNIHYGSCYFEDYSNLLKQKGIFINIHYYSPAILEIVRIVPLICNKCCVISEYSNDPDLDTLFLNYVNMIDLDTDYGDKLSYIMENAQNIANENYNKFKELKYADILFNNDCIGRLRELENISNKIIDGKINILYGGNDIYIDVSQKCLIHFLRNNKIEIPKNISFNDYFGDPILDVKKKLVITIGSNTHIYDENREEDINEGEIPPRGNFPL